MKTSYRSENHMLDKCLCLEGKGKNQRWLYVSDQENLMAVPFFKISGVGFGKESKAWFPKY